MDAKNIGRTDGHRDQIFVARTMFPASVITPSIIKMRLNFRVKEFLEFMADSPA
jgi:hypothetical protein